MAFVGGPTNNLPGTLLHFPPGTVCDNHPERLAYRRVQGETDSFGFEAADLCQSCFEEYEALVAEPIVGTCEICHTADVELHDQRDPAEGPAGRIYQMCMVCIESMRASNDDDEVNNPWE